MVRDGQQENDMGRQCVKRGDRRYDDSARSAGSLVSGQCGDRRGDGAGSVVCGHSVVTAEDDIASSIHS